MDWSNGINIDGFFVLLYDTLYNKEPKLIDKVKVGLFFKEVEKTRHIKQARYEYRFYKVYPNGIGFIKKFSSESNKLNLM